MRSVVGLFEQMTEAETAMKTLADGDFYAPDVTKVRTVSALWQQMGCKPTRYLLRDIAIGIGYGVLGAGLFGVIAAVGQLSLGFGAMVALDTLLGFTLVWGVIIGGLLGFFFGAGESEQETRRFLLGILGGGTVVSVRTTDERLAAAQALLTQAGATVVKVCGHSEAHEAHHWAAHPTHDRGAAWSRRIARTLGIVLLIVLLIFFIGEGVFGATPLNVMQLSLMEGFLLLALVMTLVGIVVDWVWEGIGGLIILGSALLFVSINAIGSGYWRWSLFDPLFLLTGCLFLFAWWRTVGVDLDQHPAQPV